MCHFHLKSLHIQKTWALSWLNVQKSNLIQAQTVLSPHAAQLIYWPSEPTKHHNWIIKFPTAAEQTGLSSMAKTEQKVLTVWQHVAGFTWSRPFCPVSVGYLTDQHQRSLCNTNMQHSCNTLPLFT